MNNKGAINQDRFNEYRAFLSATDFVEDEKHIYFANANYNAVAVADKDTGIVVRHVPFAGAAAGIKNMHLQCVQSGNRICFLPAGVSCLHLYDMKSGAQRVYEFPEPAETEETLPAPQESWGSFAGDGRVYLLPCRGRQGLWSLTAEDDEPVREDWWDIASGDSVLKHGEMDRDHFYTLQADSDKLYITNVADRTVQGLSLPDEHVRHIAYDGQNFWYTLNGASDIVCWNQEQGVVERYLVPYDIYYIYGIVTYSGICFAKGHLFLLSGDGRFLYVLDREAGELKTLCEVECARGAFSAEEMMPFFKRKDHSLLCMLQNAGEILTIDLKTLEVVQSSEAFGFDAAIEDEVWKYLYKILFDRKALVFEEAGVADLGLLLQYCMEDDRG